MTQPITVIEDTLKSIHRNRPFLFDIRYKQTNHPKPVILFIHGFKGFKDWGHFNLIADYFAENDFVFCKLNLSHNGTTPEHPTDFTDLEAFGNNNFSIELDDIGVMISHLNSNALEVPEVEINVNALFVLGHSRGGGLAILKAYEDDRVKAIATLAAVSDLEKRWTEGFLEDWKEKGYQYVYNGRTKQDMPLYYQLIENLNANLDRLNIPKATKEIKQPALVIHGTADETLPLAMAKDLKHWNKKIELAIIEGAGHTFGGTHPFSKTEIPKHSLAFLKLTVTFFKEQEKNFEAKVKKTY